MFKVGIGISDFKKIIESNNYYADKSLFIKDLLDLNDEVTLITRPRRFGKTLNLDMLRYFFGLQHKGEEGLFHHLKIWQEERKDHQGRYPTIFISFKDIKKESFVSAYASIVAAIGRVFRQFDYLLQSTVLKPKELEIFAQIADEVASPERHQSSLAILCDYLHRHHNTKVLLLIDEYDTPMQEAYLHGYWREMAEFMRGLLGSALKDNRHLFKGVVTGITRVAKENLFSGINNLRVATVLDDLYATYFGLTEQEVVDALKVLNLEDRLGEIKAWYNGYAFGNQTGLYNPWSIINYFHSQKLEAYWANTSDNALIKKYARIMPASGKQQFEELIRGGEIEALIEKHMVYSDLDQDGTVDRMWTLFLISGYLKCTGEAPKNRLKLKVPNKEIMSIFEQTVTEWFEVSAVGTIFLEFIRALLAGDISLVESHLGLIAEQTFSQFDTAFDQSESFYHAFVLGMLMNLRDRYLIDSNKQSGYGRYDICLEPLDKQDQGFIIEFKAFNKRLGHKDWDQVGLEALKQIEDRKYETELIKRGVRRIKKLAIVFKGQQVKVFESGAIGG